MAGQAPQKGAGAAAASTSAAKDDGLVEVQIWRGHYVTPEHTYVPGETVRIDADEAAFLRARGFVKPDDYKPPEETQDGSVKVTAREGVNVIGLA